MIQVFRSVLNEQAIAVATQCMREGWVGYGPKCRELERYFVEMHGGWALATGSCSAALYLSALLLEPAPGDEVIVPATTFVATAMAFHWAGWHVKIADVEPDTLLVSARTLEAAITSRTRAVVAVHLYGQRAPVFELADFCTQRGYTLIEDCAHRLPVPGEDFPSGKFACYSFNAVKEAPAGEGGVIWCADPSLEAAARQLSNLGLLIDTPQRCATAQHRDYEFGRLGGLKLRLGDIAGTLALHGVRTLKESRRRRRALVQNYDLAFAGFMPHLHPLVNQVNPSGLMYVLRVQQSERESFRVALANAGVATSVHYSSLSLHPQFSRLTCPHAELAAQEVVTLPLRLDLTDSEQQQVIAAVCDWATARI